MLTMCVVMAIAMAMVVVMMMMVVVAVKKKMMMMTMRIIIIIIIISISISIIIIIVIGTASSLSPLLLLLFLRCLLLEGHEGYDTCLNFLFFCPFGLLWNQTPPRRSSRAQRAQKKTQDGMHPKDPDDHEPTALIREVVV
ncbi:hypothetical protein AK812_SmicGene19886 [Symbiodinium microadriaticum]|uniref:Uncharacterized protein n=1 Tax=Symbiodinium microadriaticum TaxID=2951 RepID=A0A1Q9DRD3_SYMMI|nr:hypothetical protein AK812_SmicGene19886 [Symbiodinium microadriaticum]